MVSKNSCIGTILGIILRRHATAAIEIINNLSFFVLAIVDIDQKCVMLKSTRNISINLSPSFLIQCKTSYAYQQFENVHLSQNIWKHKNKFSFWEAKRKLKVVNTEIIYSHGCYILYQTENEELGGSRWWIFSNGKCLRSKTWTALQWVDLRFKRDSLREKRKNYFLRDFGVALFYFEKSI